MQKINLIQWNTEIIKTTANVFDEQWVKTPRNLTGYDVIFSVTKQLKDDTIFKKDSDAFLADWKIEFVIDSVDTNDLTPWEYFFEIKGKKWNIVFTALQGQINLIYSYIDM